MAKVINLNQYRRQRDQAIKGTLDADRRSRAGTGRPLSTIEELENLRREIEKIRLARQHADDTSKIR